MNGRRFSFDPRPFAGEGIQVLHTDFGFVPAKLHVPDRPELADFPSHIVFMSTIVSEGVTGLAEAVYEPDVGSYQARADEQGRASLDYVNVFGPDRANVTIYLGSESDPGPRYRGEKRIDDSLVGTVVGSDWSEFFRNLTLLGLTKFEPYDWTSTRAAWLHRRAPGGR